MEFVQQNVQCAAGNSLKTAPMAQNAIAAAMTEPVASSAPRSLLPADSNDNRSAIPSHSRSAMQRVFRH